jgi:hypothetical protein
MALSVVCSNGDELVVVKHLDETEVDRFVIVLRVAAGALEIVRSLFDATVGY